MSDIIPVGTLEEFLRLIQRPATDKVFDQQIGGEAASIVALLFVTTID
jgi:hypothetical protein